MNKVISYVRSLYETMGITPESISMSTTLTVLTFDIMFMVLSYFVLSRLVEPLINKLTYKTEVKWDDIVFRPKALRWVWLLMPLIVGKLTIPPTFAAYPSARVVANTMIEISLVLTFMMVVIETIKSIFLLIGDHDRIDEIAEQMHQAQLNGEEFVYRPSHSLKGLQQMLVIVVIALGIILCISILFGKNPLIVVSGLGAAAAVLMLVFQDSILGVVAGVQLTANDMLQPGDWIKSTKYEANGIVQEVTLAAVKVRNWDQTIVTIPPYKLLTDGFQNWRGMQMSKGRRITRSINIDMNTIRWASAKEVELWTQQPWWRPEMIQAEGGRVVNVSAFRMYLEYFITQLPTFRPTMLYMIRELQPGADGLPIEIYFFTSRIDWKGYEMVQADALDRIIASLSDFGLRLFQRPSGSDVRARKQK